MSKFFPRAVKGNFTSFPCASPAPCPAPFRKSHSRRKHRKNQEKSPCWWCICASVTVKIRGSQVSWTFSFSTEWNCICRIFSTEMPLTLDSFLQSWMSASRGRCREGWLSNGMGARWREISPCFLSSPCYSCQAPRVLAVPAQAHRAPPWPRTRYQPLADTRCCSRPGLQLPQPWPAMGPTKSGPPAQPPPIPIPRDVPSAWHWGCPGDPQLPLLFRGGTGPRGLP